MECKNCKKPLTAEDNFCNSCGAKVIDKRLTLKNAWNEFTERFFNVDSTFFKTFLHLFTKPTFVIQAYINGVRKRYINVFSYFAIALTFSGIQIFVVRKFFPEVMEIPFGNLSNYPQDFNNSLNSIYDYASILVLLNLPIYALVGRLTFIGNKKYNYAENFVIMTYIFSHFSIVSMPIVIFCAMLGVNYYILGYIMFIPLFLYTAFIYKKLYQLTIGQFFVRGLILIAIIIVFSILLGLLQMLFYILNGDFEKMIEAEKAKRAVSYIASSAINWTS